MARWTSSVLGAGWLWLLLAACNGGQTGDEGAPRKPDAGRPRDAGASGEQFFDAILRGFGAQRYLPADSIAELGEWSDQVALGTIASIRAGGVRRGSEGDNTAVVELDVAEMLAGEPAEKLYVWFYSNGIDAAWLPDPPPDNRLLLFLTRSGDEDAAVATRAALPDLGVLYHPTTPQGMAMEDESGAFALIENSDLRLFPESSFDALIETVRDELQPGDR